MMKKLIYFGTMLLGFAACKQEVNQPAGNENANYSKVVLNADTTVHKFQINNQYTYVNEIGGVYYYANDITLTDRQFNALVNLSNTDLSATERSTIVSSFTRTWPNNTVYYSLPVQSTLLDENYALFLESIREAIDLISSQTSVQFVERKTELAYVQFVFSTAGNDSPLGWTQDSVNTVNINSIDMPIMIAHELMHSLGIHHEQTRPDRDDFIIVYLDRVQPGLELNFAIDPTFEGNGTFDFNSIMLYGSYDYSIDPNQPVMTKLDGSTFPLQFEAISAGDYAGINALYPADN